MAIKKQVYNISKIVLVSIFLNLIQIISITLFIYYKYKNPYMIEGNFILNVIAISIGVNSIITGIIFYNLLFKKGNNNLIDTLNYLEALNKTLRTQRHDYLNHIQVIYSLMELEEYDEARRYIEPVYKDIIRVSKALKTSKPAVNALLQAKLQVAEKNNIDMELEIKSDLQYLNIEPWEFCRIIGNIIDNAIFSLKEKPDNKYILVEFSEDLENIRINISNNGNMIPKDIIDKIYDAGFTTKGNKGDGMGLAIVKEIIENFSGTISVISTIQRTSFEVVIPKK
ncbi:sensor histidine kinase regulating citrate/malate metabolism [Clostridium saccharoperbutylacetonicum]|uniref:histidine kinase n=1 Tax=Clostridium saccharoperbutylacetonicum N1-4(HMT) TaxID=931276 RepID=M1MEP8_9CLOT|nr:Spo0B domain-containing protein [Clostridium saccharoperbutylacetonicum]AGF54843.1 histidine kinase-, DNA gyrase B-, and HSP90-like ATPase [Clostridium saccharoperbutylacetonicum N1-4(HMT)]NRT64452.1 sensor histidine kinase regulating citrate/malate metabolism [Clostridium saccharoperbutylacetonicum]NSB27823.1 sensor histidine kinase regulating citrate/malate metabolism [Clostridium saccharoperbutylacetonicum]NSB41308.1 sensor histidine kinase regulating citrate/malate metabolism [Clostridiu